MTKAFSYLCAMISALPLTCCIAEEIPAAPSVQAIENNESPVAAIAPSEPTQEPAAAPNLEATAPKITKKTTAPKTVSHAPFHAFTGKVKGKKVRVRLSADLESQVIKELNKNDLLSVIGEQGDFWAVEPPAGIKAYVFRSYILDNVVEGNRVNVRLKPDLEAPVIGHLNAGEKIDGAVSPLNHKWLEITPPSNTRFYIAKELVDNIGGPEYKHKYDKRKNAAEQLLEAAALISKAELQKPFDEMDIERVSNTYTSVVNDYADLPEYVAKAKDSLAQLQEAFLQKKISYLEERSSLAGKGEVRHKGSAGERSAQVEKTSAAMGREATDRMKLWEPIEESLYLSWARMNDDKGLDSYYQDQKINAVAISGILEAYTAPVKNKPGDFILRDKDIPVGYVYSTKHNLQNLVGKKVTFLVTQRPNNNFAYPAYYVLSVEQ